MGLWQTANYMRRAIVPLDKIGTNYTPATYYNKDDTWARMVDSEKLMTSYYGRIKAEAFGSVSFLFIFRHTYFPWWALVYSIKKGFIHRIL